MYNSDIINQYGSDVLMEYFNSWGISANPDTFRLFRSEVAQNQKDELLKGEIHNLEKEVFGVAHIDNKEFLKKYKRQGDRIIQGTGITLQQPNKTLVLPDTGDVTEGNSSSIENDQKKLVKNERFESSFKEIPEYVKPALPHTTTSKYAKPSAFQVTNDDIHLLQGVKKLVTLHILTRSQFAKCYKKKQNMPNLRGLLAMKSEENVKKSQIIYLELIPEYADRKDVMLTAINRLKNIFIKVLGWKHLVVSADLKAFQLICSIKDDYGEETDWLLPYLADMHILMSYFAGVYTWKAWACRS